MEGPYLFCYLRRRISGHLPLRLVLFLLVLLRLLLRGLRLRLLRVVVRVAVQRQPVLAEVHKGRRRLDADAVVVVL